jgi:hypothetical protein
MKVSLFWATFSLGNKCVLVLTKITFGFILGDFFTNLSGLTRLDWKKGLCAWLCDVFLGIVTSLCPSVPVILDRRVGFWISPVGTWARVVGEIMVESPLIKIFIFLTVILG